MSALALTLVLLGSVFHIAWNVLAKRAEDKMAFLWIALVPAASAGGIYYSLWWREFITPVGFYCLVATSLIHVLYLELLAGSYRFADLSFVYPYSRGVGAVVATVGGIVLLNERPLVLGGIGIALSVGAMFLEPLKAGLARSSSLSSRGLVFTIGTGLMIGVYLLIDTVGVREISSGRYLLGLFFGMVVLMTPKLLLKGRLRREIRRSGGWRPLGAGALIGGAYWTILAGMEMAPISYVAAVRSSGVVMSGFAGWLFLQEKVSHWRWMAIALITAGVTLIGLS